ncbi:MAG: hypothetical protein COC15_00510 [Legionellales bacterium]|nr:MAG: hypothetical protein COC15_00510 [Legionellales bacterium]
MALLLGVSRSGYYFHVNATPSRRFCEDAQLLKRITVLFENSRATYGSYRIRFCLAKDGMCIGRRRVVRLMKQAGLVAKKRRLFKKTTVVNKKLPVAQNILAQQFKASRPNEKWVSDISYVRTKEGWLYVAVVLDLFSRKVIGLAMGRSLHTELVNRAFRQAIQRRGMPTELLHHSDRGCQYTSHAFQELLNLYGVRCSMSGKGNCYDNAAMESFFATLKTECIYFEIFQTREEAKFKIFDYCEIFYNSQRLHSTLGYLHPNEIEALYFMSEKVVQ